MIVSRLHVKGRFLCTLLGAAESDQSADRSPKLLTAGDLDDDGSRRVSRSRAAHVGGWYGLLAAEQLPSCALPAFLLQLGELPGRAVRLGSVLARDVRGAAAAKLCVTGSDTSEVAGDVLR